MAHERTIDEAEAEARREIAARYSLELELLDNLLSEISLGCGAVSGRDHDRGVGFLHLLLFNRAVNAMRRAREDAACGYGGQALALCRCAYEDWGTIRYTDAHPDEVAPWLKYILPERAQEVGGVPPFSDIWEALKPIIGDEVGDLYGMLCEFSHPRSTGLSWLVQFDAGGSQLTVGPQTHEFQVRAALHHLTLVAGLLLTSVESLQVRLLGQAVRSKERLELLDGARRMCEKTASQIQELMERMRPPAEFEPEDS